MQALADMYYANVQIMPHGIENTQAQHWVEYNVWGMKATYLTEVTLTLLTAVLLTLLSKAKTNGCLTKQTTHTDTLAMTNTWAGTH